MILRQTAPGAEVVMVTLAPVPPLTIGSPRVQNNLVRAVLGSAGGGGGLETKGRRWWTF